MAAGEKVIPEITVGNQTYKLMDETAREHLVEVKSTTPTSEDNRLWIKEMSAAEEEANTYEVPTIDEFNDLKSALSELGRMNYRALIRGSNDYIAFHATAGDSITIKTVDGSNFVSGLKIRFYGENGVMQNYWWLNTGGERTITVPTDNEFFYAQVYDGASDQDVYVILNGSYYDLHPNVTDLENGMIAVSPAAYMVQVDSLGVMLPFYAKAGDTVSFEVVSGDNADNHEVYFYFANKTQKTYWQFNSIHGKKRTVTMPSGNPACFVKIIGGSTQSIYIRNESSFYDLRSDINALQTEVGKVQENIENTRILCINSQYEFAPTWEQGSLDSSTGQPYNTQHGIRSGWLYIEGAKKIHVSLVSRDLLGEAKVFFYPEISANKNDTQHISGTEETYNVPANACYARINFNNWSTSISVSDVSQIFDEAYISVELESAVNKKIINGINILDLFQNERVWESDLETIDYAQGATYAEKNVQTMTSMLENGGTYILFCGNIDAESSACVRLYVKYTDDSVSRFDARNNHKFGIIKLDPTKTISYANLYIIPVNGTAAASNKTGVFSRIAVVDGATLDFDDLIAFEDPIPAYYVANLQAAEARVRALEKDCSFDGESFVFLTDPHYSVDYIINGNVASNSINKNHSIPMINHLIDNTATRMLLFGGDLLNTSEGIDQMVHSCNKFISMFGKHADRMANIVGNHEYYTDLGNPSYGRPTANELYGALIKYNEYQVIAKGPMDSYCFDNKAQKIRYFMIGCGRDTETTIPQTEWYLNALLDTPSDYRIIVVGHAFMTDNMAGFRSYHQNMVEALDAITAGATYTFNGNSYNYAPLKTAGVKVICVITGHTHIDGYLISAGGTLCICTTCDCWQRNYELIDGEPVGVPRDAAHGFTDVDEQAFDVYQFDFANSLIYCTRIGYGSNRTFRYGTNPGPVT